MSPSELKYRVQQTNENSHFFDYKTMRFFGDSMRNFGVRLAVIQSQYDQNGDYVESGIMVEVYELYRKHPVKHGLKTSHYFDRETFRSVYPIN